MSPTACHVEFVSALWKSLEMVSVAALSFLRSPNVVNELPEIEVPPSATVEVSILRPRMSGLNVEKLLTLLIDCDPP
ncbi:MAG: hypothetical protein SFV21_07460 [Rhodospirillaceae bacterium]|nr:hypothetical protein [Rhodospirillaceae bacterium]